MPPSKFTYDLPSDVPSSVLREDGIESVFIAKLQSLKYDYRPDITNRATLEQNFREKFESLNRVRLTEPTAKRDSDHQPREAIPQSPSAARDNSSRLLDEIVVADVFTASKTLRSINSFTRDDGTPLNYTRRKKEGRMRKDERGPLLHSSFKLLTFPTLGVNPRRAMEQIVEYKNDPGNGYTKTLLCFMQLFIVSHRDSTFNAATAMRHSALPPGEALLPRLLRSREANKAKDNRCQPIYQFADEAKVIANTPNKPDIALAA
jgi:type I restriction enzyme R subunit